MQVGEASFYAGGLIEEGERPPRDWQTLRDALTVLLGLDFNSDERRAFPFGLNDACGLTVDKKEVVGLTKPVPEGEFADGNAGAGVDVGVGPVLDEPSSGDQHAVDGLAGFFFGRQSWMKALGHQCMTVCEDVTRLPNIRLSKAFDIALLGAWRRPVTRFR